MLEYFYRLQPSLVIEGARFQHIDPHLDPLNIEHLWGFAALPDRVAALSQCAEPRAFMGHVHEWGVYTPRGPVEWAGGEPFVYQSGERYLTTIHAVVDGWCAVFDTTRDHLEPVRVA